MELTLQQASVFEKIKEFIESDAQVFILRGYAGTGKTTMIKVIADYISQSREVALMAPTGRAARVLSKKTAYEAKTIHSTIYSGASIVANEVDDIAETDFKMVYPIQIHYSKIVAIVDEASMLSGRKVEQEVYKFGTENLIDDLLTFVRFDYGGKIIFVGDPAQLPPIDENRSNALDAAFFIQKGLMVMEASLTEVLRQGEGSAVLHNAMLLRGLLENEKRNSLVFKECKGEVESLPADGLLNKFLETKRNGVNDSVIITFSNKSAQDYNKEVRRMLYAQEEPSLMKGDVLQIVQNNYKLGYMNGDFVKVLSVGATESCPVPVYVPKGGGRAKSVINLEFRHITIQCGTDAPIGCLLLLNLLNNGAASLSIDEHRALFIHFCMRNPKLKRNSVEFCSALKEDVYYNSLKAKYGYAVTGHKCQGGEWPTVFVDYSGRTGLSDDCLRWAYTATTRARNTLYFVNLPHITPFDKFRIEEIQKCSKINEEFRVLNCVGSTPFHASTAPDYLRAKYHCIMRNLEWTQYKVLCVESKPYQEIYHIDTPDGVVIYDVRYKKGGLFSKAIPRTWSEQNALLDIMLNDENAMPLLLDYTPSDEIHSKLLHLLRSACDDAAVAITNIVEHKEDYSVVYYLYTSATYSYIKFYINDNNFVTYAKPMSLNGTDDSKLSTLIEYIQKYLM